MNERINATDTSLAEQISGANLALGLASNGCQVHLQQKPKRAKKPMGAPKPKVQQGPVEPAIPEPVKPASNLLDDILRAGGTLAGGKVAEAISMANTILTDVRTVAAFVSAIDTADALALHKWGFDRLEEDVRREWYALTLPELEKQLQVWAREDDTAQKVLAALGAFKKSQVDVVGPLWQLYVEIVRPAKNARSYFYLGQLLKELLEKGLVEKLINRQYYPVKAVVLGEGHTAGYLPAMKRGIPVPMAEAGWPWIKEAEDRVRNWARAQDQRLNELKEEATGLTPAEAKEGKEGKVFLQTGPHSGALLYVGDMRVRVAVTIGMLVRRSSWMSWDTGRWPSEIQRNGKDIIHAFEAWKKTIPPPPAADAHTSPTPTTTSAQPAE